jgi:hypothetical protein
MENFLAEKEKKRSKKGEEKKFPFWVLFTRNGNF